MAVQMNIKTLQNYYIELNKCALHNRNISTKFLKFLINRQKKSKKKTPKWFRQIERGFNNKNVQKIKNKLTHGLKGSGAPLFILSLIPELIGEAVKNIKKAVNIGKQNKIIRETNKKTAELNKQRLKKINNDAIRIVKLHHKRLN